MPQLERIAPGFAPHVWIALEWSSPAKLVMERMRDVVVFERCIIIVPTENTKLCEAAEFFVLDKMRERDRAVAFFAVSGNEKQIARMPCLPVRFSRRSALPRNQRAQTPRHNHHRKELPLEMSND